MKYRQIARLTKDNNATVIGYDSKINEFRVQVIKNGDYKEECDYFTDDKQDAFQTAQTILETIK